MRLLSRVVAALVLGALFRPVLLADGPWRTAMMGNFQVYTDAAPADVERLIDQLRQFSAGVDQFLGADVADLGTVRVFVFATHGEYREYRSAAQAAGHAIPFYFVPTLVVSLKPQYVSEEMLRRQVIFHELTHLLEMRLTRREPPWFVEGIAEYFSTAELYPNACVFGSAHFRHLQELRYGGDAGLISVARLVRVQPTDSRDSSKLYSNGWLLTHYWLAHQARTGGAKKLDRYVRLIAAGAEASDATFQKAFGLTYAQMDKELAMYTEKGRFMTATVPVEVPRPSPVVWTDLPPRFKDALFAVFRLVTTQAQDVRGRIARVVAEYPTAPDVRLYAAAAALCAHDPDEALRQLRVAADIGGSGSRVPAWAARLVAQHGAAALQSDGYMDDAWVAPGRGLALQALALNPREPFAAEALAQIEAGARVIDTSNYTRLLEAVDGGWATAELRETAARLAMRRGDREKATAIARPLLDETIPRDIRKSAEAILSAAGQPAATGH